MSTTCPTCGYETEGADGACRLCGGLQGARRLATPPPESPQPLRPSGIPVGWVYLGAGSVLALAFTLTPMLGFMGWLLGSLFHETGHVVFAWYVGCPSWPVLSLAGHAAAFYKPQSGPILLFVLLILAVATWQAWRAKRLRGLATTLLVLWPLFAFVDTARNLGFLLSGHLGELTFAGIFLWRARTGEAVKREAERPLYACLGWFLVARNVSLCFGLAFVPSVRAWYHASGSFGLTNDYARVAYQVLHIPLEAVAIFMLLVAASVFPLVLAITMRPTRETALPYSTPVGGWSPSTPISTRSFQRERTRPTIPQASSAAPVGAPEDSPDRPWAPRR